MTNRSKPNVNSSDVPGGIKTRVSSSRPDLDMLRSWACWSPPCPAVRRCNVRPPRKQHRGSMRLSATLVVDIVFVIDIGYWFAPDHPMGIRSELRSTGVLLLRDTRFGLTLSVLLPQSRNVAVEQDQHCQGLTVSRLRAAKSFRSNGTGWCAFFQPPPVYSIAAEAPLISTPARPVCPPGTPD